MNRIVLLILVLISLGVFNSCDRVYCRDCEEFNGEITNWRNDVEEINSKIEFIRDLGMVQFQLDSIIINEPFEECEISGSVEGVTCMTKKEYFYTIPEMNLKYSEEFENYEDSFDDRTWVNYRFSRLLSDTIYQSTIYSINNSANSQIQFEQIDILSQFGITYNNILKFNIKQVLNLTTGLNESPSFFKELYFKEKFGLIAFTTADDVIYIRKK